MEIEFEKIEKKSRLWFDVITLLLVVYFAFFPNVIFRSRPVWALTQNAGTDFIACTAGMMFTSVGSDLSVTLYWTFTSQQNDYFDNDGLPTNPEGGPCNDTTIMAASTQAHYWIEIDDSSNFSTPEVQANAASASQYYTYIGSALSYGETYFWRLKIQDSYASVTDWIYGSSFSLNPSIVLKGKILLKGNIFFKFP